MSDRLSNLPESIPFHISSFLPLTKYVIQMSILSRRWRYLWTSMHTLDFDPIITVRNGLRESYEKMRFVNFVNKVRQLHDMSHIQRFRITCLNLDMSCVNEWISVAVKKNVQELILNIHTINSIELPDCLFTCKPLVSLKLVASNSMFTLPVSVCLIRLRTLQFHSVTLSRSFENLLSSCPVLEKLTLAECRWSDDEVVNISSPTLKELNIYFGNFSSIIISNSNLIWFRCLILFGKNCFLENLSLVNAFIGVETSITYCSKSYNECFHQVSKLLRGVSNARSLTLSHFTLKQLSNAPNLFKSLPTFYNLNKLILISLRKAKYFRSIAYLLGRCPVLESLVIDMMSPEYFKVEGEESKTLCLEGCRLHDHLKEVKIRFFRGTEEELEFVKLLLSTASTMERIIIIQVKDLEKRTEVSEKLLMFQRASANCIISIS